MRLAERIKLCWRILVTRNVTEQSLFQAALMVNRCAIRGEVKGMAVLVMNDGTKMLAEYQLTAKKGVVL